MATRLFLRFNPNDLAVTAGTSSTALSAATTASGTEIQFGSPGLYEALSPPIVNSFTLSGTVSFTLTAWESNMSANAGLRAKLFKYNATDGYTLIGTGNDEVELATAETEMSWTLTPTSTVIALGDRLAVRLYITNIGTMGGGFAGNVYVNSAEADARRSFVDFTETIDWVDHGRTGTGANTTGDITSAGSGTVFGQVGTGANTLVDFSISAIGGLSDTALTHALYMGGYKDGAGSRQRNIERTSVPTNVQADITATLSEFKDGVSCLSTANKSVFIGGQTGSGSGTGNAAWADTLTYAGETVAAASYALAARCFAYSWSPGSTGYYASGRAYADSAYYNTSYSYVFATGSGTSLAATLDTAKSAGASVESSTKGYEGGGRITGGSHVREISGFVFATESASTVSATITLNAWVSSQGGGLSFADGYFLLAGTGATPKPDEKLTFATEAISELSVTTATAVRSCGEAGSTGYIARRAAGSALYTFDPATNTLTLVSTNGTTKDAGSNLGTFEITTTTGTGANTTDALTSAAIGITQVYDDRTGTGANTVTVTSEGVGALVKIGTGANTLQDFTVKNQHGITPGEQGFAVVWGGFDDTPSPVLASDKYHFNTRTASGLSSANTTQCLWYCGAVKSSSAAYLLSGRRAADINVGDGAKLIHASVTYSSLSAVIATPRRYSAGMSSDTNGYLLGGTGGTTEIDGVLFSSDTGTNIATALPVAQEHSSANNNPTHGYTVGGSAYPNGSTGVRKFTLASETVSTLSGTLQAIVDQSHACTSQVANYVVAAGVKNKIAYASDTVSVVTSITARDYTSGISGATEAIQVTHGSNCYAFSFITEIETSYPRFPGITYRRGYGASSFLDYTIYGRGTQHVADVLSGDVALGSSVAQLGEAISAGTGVVSIYQGAGYFAGGNSAGASVSDIQRIDVGSALVETLAAALSFVRESGAGFASALQGYVAAGWSGGNSSGVDGLLFADETAINNSAALSLARTYVAANSASTKGYVGGGYIADTSDVIDAVTFASDTAAAIAAVLVESRRNACGVQSDSRGYFAGGVYTGLNTGQIDGIRFDTEAQINPSAGLTVQRQGAAGLSATNYAYFCGGNGGSNLTEIDGLHFATESSVNPSAVLATARYTACGVSSFAKGYCGGGHDGAVGKDEIDGLDFITETALNPSGALATAKYGVMGMSLRAERYVGGSSATVAVTSAGVGLAGDPLITGTGGATLAAFTQESAGVVNNGGAVVGTGGNTVSVSSAGTGLQIYIGTGANTTTQGSAGTGTVVSVSSGAGANTTTQSSAALGNVPVTGGGATAASMSSAGVGAVSITGMGDSAFIGFMQAAAGTLAVTGAAPASTLDNVSISSSFGYITDYTPASHAAKMAGVEGGSDRRPVVAGSDITEIIITT